MNFLQAVEKVFCMSLSSADGGELEGVLRQVGGLHLQCFLHHHTGLQHGGDNPRL